MAPAPSTLPCSSAAPLPLRPKILNETKTHLTAVWWLVCRDAHQRAGQSCLRCFPVSSCVCVSICPPSPEMVLRLFSTSQKGPVCPRNDANSILMTASKVKGVSTVRRPRQAARVAVSSSPWGRRHTRPVTLGLNNSRRWPNCTFAVPPQIHSGEENRTQISQCSAPHPAEHTLSSVKRLPHITEALGLVFQRQILTQKNSSPPSLHS